MLEFQKHTRCFMEPIQLLSHPGLKCGTFTHFIPFHASLYYLLVGRRMESVLGVHEHRRGLNDQSLDEHASALPLHMLYSPEIEIEIEIYIEIEIGIGFKCYTCKI